MDDKDYKSGEKRPVPLRLDTGLTSRFKSIRPEHGSLPDFVELCLAEYIRLWGDRPTPTQVAAEAAQRVFQRS